VDQPPDQIATLAALGLYPVERLPWWAADLLARGFTGDAVAELAGLDGQDPLAVRDVLPAVWAELGVRTPPDPLTAARRALDTLARQYLAGTISREDLLTWSVRVRIAVRDDASVNDSPFGDLEFDTLLLDDLLENGTIDQDRYEAELDREVRLACAEHAAGAPSPDYLAAVWVLGRNWWSMWWAAEWRDRGYDTPALTALNRLPVTADEPELRDLLRTAFAELGVRLPAVPEAGGVVLGELARRFLSGETDARALVKRLRRLPISRGPQISPALQAFPLCQLLRDPVVADAERTFRDSPELDQVVRTACLQQLASPVIR
jgi:hypothetical protein